MLFAMTAAIELGLLAEIELIFFQYFAISQVWEASSQKNLDSRANLSNKLIVFDNINKIVKIATIIKIIIKILLEILCGYISTDITYIC